MLPRVSRYLARLRVDRDGVVWPSFAKPRKKVIRRLYAVDKVKLYLRKISHYTSLRARNKRNAYSTLFNVLDDIQRIAVHVVLANITYDMKQPRICN